MDDEDGSDEAERFLINDEEKGEGGSNSVPKDLHTGIVPLHFLFVLLQIVGVICIALACWWSRVYLKGFSWDGSGKNFNWHIIFMTCFIFSYGNAAVVYRVTRKTEKFTAKLIHGGMNLAAFLFSVLGLIAVFRFHNVKHIPNVYSLHSWLGIGSATLYACQLVFGFLGFLFPKFSDDIRRIYLKIHVYFGAIIFALVVAAAVSGVTEKMLFVFMKVYKLFPPVAYVANFFGVMIALFGMIVGYFVQ